MRMLASLCQGIADRLGWRRTKPGPDYLGSLLDSGAGTLPETLIHLL